MDTRVDTQADTQFTDLVTGLASISLHKLLLVLQSENPASTTIAPAVHHELEVFRSALMMTSRSQHTSPDPTLLKHLLSKLSADQRFSLHDALHHSPTLQLISHSTHSRATLWQDTIRQMVENGEADRVYPHFSLAHLILLLSTTLEQIGN